MEESKVPKIYVETLEEFERWNHEIIRDIYQELKGFFGGIKSYNYLVKELYGDTYALILFLNGEKIHSKRPPLESYETERGSKYNKDLQFDYTQMDDERHLIQHNIIGGSSNIFITNETVWNMAFTMDYKQKRKYYQALRENEYENGHDND